MTRKKTREKTSSVHVLRETTGRLFGVQPRMAESSQQVAHGNCPEVGFVIAVVDLLLQGRQKFVRERESGVVPKIPSRRRVDQGHHGLHLRVLSMELTVLLQVLFESIKSRVPAQLPEVRAGKVGRLLRNLV